MKTFSLAFLGSLEKSFRQRGATPPFLLVAAVSQPFKHGSGFRVQGLGLRLGGKAKHILLTKPDIDEQVRVC